jgi:ABC-type transporter Mla subunit MlaD
MSNKRAKRNNILAGLLVIVCLSATVVIIVILGGALEALGKRDYTVRFPIETGAEGVEVGSRVTVGGVNAGTVKGRRFAMNGENIEGINVTIAVDKAIPLREGTVAYLQLPILGGTASINFSQLGDGAPLDEDDLIEGRIAPPGILSSTGFGEEQAEALRRIIDSARETTDRVNEITKRFSDTVVPDVETIVGSTRERYPTWLERIDSITANADETVARGPAIAEEIEQRVAEFRGFIEDVRPIIDENREQIRIAIGNFEDASANTKEVTAQARSFMDRLNGEMSDRAVAILESGQAGLEEARSAITKADSIVSEQRPQIRASLANFRLASDQLRDTLIEVRRSPWRLLYRPDTRELEYELLYDAARSYAGAVTNLRGAAESLEAVSASDTPDRDEVATLMSEVEQAFERYRQAEEFFLEQLIEAPGASR